MTSLSSNLNSLVARLCDEDGPILVHGDTRGDAEHPVPGSLHAHHQHRVAGHGVDTDPVVACQRSFKMLS